MKNQLLIIVIIFFACQFSSAQNHSLDFDGADDLVTSAVMTDTLNTIEFWAKNDVAIDGVAQLSLPFNFSTAGEYIFFNNAATYLTGETIGISNDVSTPTATNSILTSGWHHIAFTSNGIYYNKIYIDGILANMISTSSPVILNTKLDLGHRTIGSGPLPYSGRLDEIRIWKVTRTQTQIQNNMNIELTGNEPNLVLYYKMDNISSSCDIQDCSPNAFHGIRTGINNTNNLPQFSTDTPVLSIVLCGAATNCTNASIAEFGDENSQIQIFPNPTNGEATIFFNQRPNNATIKIFSLTGQKIFEKSNINEDQLRIEISNQAKGMYFVEIEQNEKISRKKLIKNNISQ